MNWGMTMSERDGDEIELDALFLAARRETAHLPPALEARMLADATLARRTDRAARWRDRLHRLLAGLGGWPAVGGLAAASAAGVWLGLAPPAFLPDPVGIVAQAVVAQDMDITGAEDLVLALSEDG